MPRSLLYLLLAGALAVSACKREPPRPEAVIAGRVIDNFGRPIRGAEVSIRDSAFHATTDDGGSFEVPYAPGSFQLRIEATNCVPMTRDLQVTQAVRYPLGTKMLLSIPDGPPDVAMVATEDGYRPIEAVTLDRRVVTFGSPFAIFPSRCAIFTLHRPVPTLRGNALFIVLSDAHFRLVQVDGDHVTTDPYVGTIGECPERPFGAHTVDGRTGSMPGRQYYLAELPRAVVYCFIRSTRINPEDIASNRGYCFQWEPDARLQWGVRMTAAPQETLPPDCARRSDGRIPCSNRCYEAHHIPVENVNGFFLIEAGAGRCYEL